MKHNINRFITHISIGLVILLITGCVGTDWDCKAPDSSFRCTSIEESDNAHLSKTKKDRADTIDKHMFVNFTNKANKSQNITYKIDSITPSRVPEKIGKILITPYVDDIGNLHSAKYIYTVDRKSYWVLGSNDTNHSDHNNVK